MSRKVNAIALAVVAMLSGCDNAGLTDAQLFELKKLEMQQKHELDLKKIETVGVQSYEEAYNQAPQAAPTNLGAAVPNSPQPVDNGSSVLGTVAAVGAGALAGYAVSGLLDNGYRSYSDSTGNTRYIDASGKEISRAQFEDYRRDHPTQSKISDANQKAQELVKKGQEKTVQAVQTVKEKTSPYVNKVSGAIKSTSTTKPSPIVSKPTPRPTSRPTSKR